LLLSPTSSTSAWCQLDRLQILSLDLYHQPVPAAGLQLASTVDVEQAARSNPGCQLRPGQGSLEAVGHVGPRCRLNQHDLSRSGVAGQQITYTEGVNLTADGGQEAFHHAADVTLSAQ